MPGRVLRAGEVKPALYDEHTLHQRLAFQTSLVERQAALAGYAREALPRAQWPGEVFEIDERNPTIR